MARTISLFAIAMLWSSIAAAQDADAKTSRETQTQKASVTLHKDLVFAEVDGQKLKLDLYVPQVDAPSPLVVWIHGGGWQAGSRKKPPVQSLTQHGFALASISYRFTDKAIFPAQIHDCKAAIRWLRGNADRFRYNADWIAVAGSSAGGHLALLTGLTGDVEPFEGTVGGYFAESSSAQAVVDYFGPSDFVLRGKTRPERSYTQTSGSFALLGGSLKQGSLQGEVRLGKLSPEMERDASPAHYVSADDPPLLIFHGSNDKVVFPDQSKHITKRYSDAGLDAKLVVLEGAGHGGKVFYRDEHLQTMIDFLQRHAPK
jgi:acetyl esterase/lipase